MIDLLRIELQVLEAEHSSLLQNMANGGGSESAWLQPPLTRDKDMDADKRVQAELKEVQRRNENLQGRLAELREELSAALRSAIDADFEATRFREENEALRVQLLFHGITPRLAVSHAVTEVIVSDPHEVAAATAPGNAMLVPQKPQKPQKPVGASAFPAQTSAAVHFSTATRPLAPQLNYHQHSPVPQPSQPACTAQAMPLPKHPPQARKQPNGGGLLGQLKSWGEFWWRSGGFFTCRPLTTSSLFVNGFCFDPSLRGFAQNRSFRVMLFDASIEGRKL